MKCELTKQQVCNLSCFKGILISINYSSENYKTKEDFLNALQKLKNKTHNKICESRRKL